MVNSLGFVNQINAYLKDGKLILKTFKKVEILKNIQQTEYLMWKK